MTLLQEDGLLEKKYEENSLVSRVGLEPTNLSVLVYCFPRRFALHWAFIPLGLRRARLTRFRHRPYFRRSFHYFYLSMEVGVRVKLTTFQCLGFAIQPIIVLATDLLISIFSCTTTNRTCFLVTDYIDRLPGSYNGLLCM
jgi:hypothetical protein